jgi:cytochrome c-type biogenesis protein CcmH
MTGKGQSKTPRSRGRRLAGAVALLLAFAGPLAAVTPDEILHDSGLEARAREISQKLRCLVCQNQSIDDSDAPLAHDLRVLVRERLSAGDTDSQAIGFIVARYGNFVLLKPPLQINTLALWFGPLLFLLIAVLGFGRYVLSGNRTSVTAEPLVPGEQERLDALMHGRRMS